MSPVTQFVRYDGQDLQFAFLVIIIEIRLLPRLLLCLIFLLIFFRGVIIGHFCWGLALLVCIFILSLVFILVLQRPKSLFQQCVEDNNLLDFAKSILKCI